MSEKHGEPEFDGAARTTVENDREISRMRELHREKFRGIMSYALLKKYERTSEEAIH